MLHKESQRPMKKILYIVQRYHPAGGGAEHSMKILAEYMAKQPGWQVDLWTSDALDIDALWDVDKAKVEIPEETINGVNVKRFRVAPWIFANRWINKIMRSVLSRIPQWDVKCLFTPPTSWEMLVEVARNKELDYDIVHVTSAPYFVLFYVAWKLTKKIGAKFVISPKIHIGESEDDPIRKIYLKPESAPFYKWADSIIVQTNTAAKAIVKFCAEQRLKINESKFVKSAMGLFFNEISGGKGDRFRKKYGIKSEEKIVFYVGAKVVEKGCVNLVKAMELLWKNGIKARLVLAGGYTKQFEKFWATVSDEVKKNTVCLGYIDDEDKWDLYDAGDVFSMVSKSDSFGIAYLEAWYYGKPVLGCDTDVIREVIDEGKDGYLVGFHDVEVIAEKIRKLLEDNELRKKMGEYGRARVMKEYGWENQLEIIRKEYERLHSSQARNNLESKPPTLKLRRSGI